MRKSAKHSSVAGTGLGAEMPDAAPPLVSVVMPTYNHAAFIGEAIASVRAQTFPDWELIIVNNHSTDNTADIIASFHDPRIQHVLFRNHGIIAASRNEGFRRARGEFIALLDSDDIWAPDKLRRQLQVIRNHPELDAVSTALFFLPRRRRLRPSPPGRSGLSVSGAGCSKPSGT